MTMMSGRILKSKPLRTRVAPKIQIATVGKDKVFIWPEFTMSREMLVTAHLWIKTRFHLVGHLKILMFDAQPLPTARKMPTGNVVMIWTTGVG